MKTKRGIYLNIKDSNYAFTPNEYPKLTFYFSSMFYLNKFKSEYDSEVERFNQSANNIYKNKFILKMDLLALLRLYVLIEKRGFYITYEGIEINCLDNLAFVLDVEQSSMTMTSSDE